MRPRQFCSNGVQPRHDPPETTAVSGMFAIITRCVLNTDRRRASGSREWASRLFHRPTRRRRTRRPISAVTPLGLCHSSVTRSVPMRSAAARFVVFLRISGAGERTRTFDLLITNQLLYQLSYAGLGMWLADKQASQPVECTTSPGLCGRFCLELPKVGNGLPQIGSVSRGSQSLSGTDPSPGVSAR